MLRFRLLPVVVASLAGLASTAAFAQQEAVPRDERPTKNVLPYVEAEGDVYCTRSLSGCAPPPYWNTLTRLLFVVQKPIAPDSKPAFESEVSDGLERVDYAARFEVRYLDIASGKTHHHLDGLLVGMNDDRELKFDGTDVLRVAQKRVGNPDKPEQQGRLFFQSMRGVFGEEREYVVREVTVKKLLSKEECPGYVAKRTRTVWLRPEHGCLQEPQGIGVDRPQTYYRFDGPPLKIEADMLMPHWIPWLQAYLLQDSSAISQGNPNKTFPLMKPDGNVLNVPFASGRYTPNHARPTRAGMVGTINYDSGSRSYSGVFLLRNGKVLQLAEGHVDSQVHVSPDGCHVAYVADIYPLFWMQLYPKYYRLRVLDVCAGLGVAPTDNPFQWPNP